MVPLTMGECPHLFKMISSILGMIKYEESLLHANNQEQKGAILRWQTVDWDEANTFNY